MAGAERQNGLYYPDGSYSDRTQIRRKLLAQELEGGTSITQLTQFPKARDFDQWVEIMTRQQDERRELLGIPEAIEVEIKATEPFLLALIADKHIGGAEVNTRRLAKDINLIDQAKGYSITVGDLTDSFFFMPEVGEQIISGDEQVLFAQAALERLARNDHLIAAFGGDHDMWSKDKSGAHTIYQDFQRRFNAHYLEGVSYVTLKVNNGENIVPYGFVGSHRHKGFSVYNDAHAPLRQFRDEGVGSIVSFTAHNHIKAALTQVHKVAGGDEVKFHSLALGAYKETDRYSRKMGWPRKGEQSLGAFGLIVYPGQEQLDVCWTIEEAVDRLALLK
ncbi:MAG: hypothetical protein JW735_06310 [Prolixibacteraceae bacterium]|nr:hypothetical protein [Prolixibacteraceae bacterium]